MNQINTALCSYGMSGTVFHAPFISIHPGFNFYGVWERSKNLAQEKYPAVKVFRTYEEMLMDPAVELVVVNTPSYTHYDYAKQALVAGKNVIVEKPFTATVEQARELVSIAKENGLKLSVFQNRRWDSDFLTVKSVLDSGVLGDILEAEFHYDRYNLVLSPKAHKETPGPAVGGLYDLGPHLIDQALVLFGMPERVFADIMMTRPGSKVDDYFEILLYYPQMRVRLKSGYQFREPIPSFALHGSNGSFLKSRADVQETRLQAGVSPTADDWGVEPVSQQGLLHATIDGTVFRGMIPTLPGNYLNYYDGVYKAFRLGDALPVSGVDGLNVITIIASSQKSNAEKRVVDL
ncbi:MAG: Gfo/Idh/MocA family oxidoreductase [Saprospiraceae bacterium]|jgi:predicted dehydrogenase|nr:Gfo/Idh/MocA family oxidoreductase [Saprospiraceae bacterium]MBK6815006.1 Gfo/Idh/MocA family oxidoreductase [Saprospiraceae bacterium]MBK7372053.1 Gfo/Idh/MocA family oxidoreductase [Saprospiraceae bacterium]MBK7435493.1 Gfo/Idh/MocA family oxidoreductase [Saprospiraceae bacterium]MBK7607536.1 Gfo/Idh/MocA family oxidoreductase [Saprospiraceae bacterium]